MWNNLPEIRRTHWKRRSSDYRKYCRLLFFPDNWSFHLSWWMFNHLVTLSLYFVIFFYEVIRGKCPYSVFSPNAEKCGPENSKYEHFSTWLFFTTSPFRSSHRRCSIKKGVLLSSHLQGTASAHFPSILHFILMAVSILMYYRIPEIIETNTA